MRERHVGGWLVAAVLLAAGCGETKDDKAGPAATPPAGGAKEPATPPGPAGALDLDAFCAEIFDPGAVGAIVGVEGLRPEPPRNKLPAGMASCDLQRRDANAIPEAGATVLADCRGLSMDVAKHRELARQLGKDSYREVDIGKGGAYAKTTVLEDLVVHQITFVHGSAPCAVTVSTAHIAEDHVLALTQHVAAKLTEANHPRR